MSRLRILIMAALITTGVSCAYAGSRPSWDGTWAGMLNKTEPVSVTIAGGKVVGYRFRPPWDRGRERDRSRLPRDPDEAE
jgi:hypothetical protein